MEERTLLSVSALGDDGSWGENWRFDGEYYWHIPGRPFISVEEPIDGRNVATDGPIFLSSHPPIDKARVVMPDGWEDVPIEGGVHDGKPDLISINLREFISLPEEPVDARNLGPGEALFLGAGPPPDQLRLLVPANVNAADTTNTDQIQPSGGLGLNLQGAGYTVGVWESGGGQIRATHNELSGRVTVVDTGNLTNHATHVAGTIAASGVDANAQGMATQVALRSYTSDNDLAEMRSDASLIHVSNHSYGPYSGWEEWQTATEWGIITTSGRVDVWWEDRTLYAVEDRDFGKYETSTADLDDVLYDQPHLLSVWAVGNDRNDHFTNASWDNTYIAYFSQSPPGGTPTNTPGYWLVSNSGGQSAPPPDGNGGTGFDSVAIEIPEPSSVILLLTAGAAGLLFRKSGEYPTEPATG